MVAPSPTTRVTPTGDMLENGYQSLVTLSGDPNINLWEIVVQGPGMDGGDPIDTTTMHNNTYRTKAPSSLLELTDGQMTVAYHPAVLTQIKAQVNVEQTITHTYPDGTTIAAYGYIKNFNPTGLEEGKLPTATVDIIYTNRDSSGNEEGPTITAGSGT